MEELLVKSLPTATAEGRKGRWQLFGESFPFRMAVVASESLVAMQGEMSTESATWHACRDIYWMSVKVDADWLTLFYAEESLSSLKELGVCCFWKSNDCKVGAGLLRLTLTHRR
ncbi:hypothetical protein BHM03_00019574 [Ensete ventricosum]|nr:hypothetical protein BHM03_00019574 [Ensete ventricosum]